MVLRNSAGGWAAKFVGGHGRGFGTFELMRASAERLMCRLIQAGFAAGGAASTAPGLIGRASGVGGGAASGPAAGWLRVS